jgi:hypothetical protein
MAIGRGSLIDRHRLKRAPASRPSFSSVLVLLAVSINLLAYLMSLRIPNGAAEVNPLVHPGSLVSLGYSEGIIITVSLLISVLIRDETKRSIVQAAVVALLAGDAMNDVVFTLTGSQYLAVVTSYAFTALIPALAAIRSMQVRTFKNGLKWSAKAQMPTRAPSQPPSRPRGSPKG